MIQSGTIHFGVDAEASPGWRLHMAPGEVDELTGASRTPVYQTPDLQFPMGFNGTPTVVMSLAGVRAVVSSDAGATHDLQVELEAFDVQQEEFNIRVRTGGNSQLYDVWVNWIAYDEIW